MVATDPLRPITSDELDEAVKILKQAKNLDQSFKFITIQLSEPCSRTDESLWKSRQDIGEQPREVFMILIHLPTGHCWESIVSLSSKRVVSFDHIKDVQPAYTPEDYAVCEEVVRKDAELLKSLQKRGINSIDEVMVDLWASGRGFLGETDDPTRRIAKPILYARDETDQISFGYGRPIEGLTPVIDLNAKCIIAIEDLGIKPIAPKASQLKKLEKPADPKDVPPLKPLDIIQKEGPSFTIDDHHLKWQGWDLKIGFNAREGLTIHCAQIYDREQQKFRKVLYRASCAEMVVPYGDPRNPTYRRNAFDVGEEGLGFNANSLELGCDCVGYIHYLDGVVNESDGSSRVIKNAICIHEEDFGVLWKHTDWRSGKSNLARSRRLAISFFATVANYDYGFYYYFYQEGVVQCEVKLTGLLLTIGETLEATSESVTHGTKLRPGLSAPYHQHIFNFRLEFCVDGPQNSIYEVNCEAERGRLNVNNLQGNAFTKKKTLLIREWDAQRNMDLTTGRYWQIVNHNVKNTMGEPVSYRISPLDNSFPYLHLYSPVMKRAGFIGKHIWVTPFHPDEKYPAGMYPNKPQFEYEGLPKYTQNNRSIVDTSLVVWYNMSVLHIPRLEEWPIMPVTRASFNLIPDGFFNGNPTVYLRKDAKIQDTSCIKHSNIDISNKVISKL